MYRRTACIGGATLDRTVEPLERLRPATSNPVRSELCAGGTARNVAEALARLGCPVSLVSRVGADAAGDRVLDELATLGVALDGVDRVPDLPTASYTAVLDESGELALGLADMEILDLLPDDWLDGRLALLETCDLWVVDANLPAPALERLARCAPDGTRLYADPVSVEKSRRLGPILDRVHTLFPDRAEAAELAGLPVATEPRELAAALHRRGLTRIVLTLGGDGVWIEEPPRHERVPAVEISARVNVTGAGDCLLAGYVFAQVVAVAIDPVRCGLAAAALAVESAHPVPPELTAETLLERYRRRQRP